MQGIVNILLLVIGAIILVFLTAGLGIIPIAIWAFFVFSGQSKRSEKLASKLNSTLMRDELVEAIATQHRPFGLMSRRRGVAITNSRVVFIDRGIFGGFTMLDFQWKDLVDVQVEENVLSTTFGSNLIFYFAKFETPSAKKRGIRIDGIGSEAASQIYGLAQAHEQAWEEKRRIRNLEDKRAMSGGFQMQSPSFPPQFFPTQNTTTISAAPAQLKAQSEGAFLPIPPAPIASSGRMNSLVEEIQQAKSLMDAGVISDAEFQELKSKILSRSM